MSKVTVTADENGNVVVPSPNNPEYGYVRVEQYANQINDEGWLRIVKRTAFIKGKVDDLMDQNYHEGFQLPGKIVVKESLTPFYEENPEKDLKIAGDTGVVCRLDDQPIYRQSFFTTNLSATDELINHTNSDEIRQKQIEARGGSSLQKKFKLLRDRKLETTSSKVRPSRQPEL